jgi:hypothetical protein
MMLRVSIRFGSKFGSVLGYQPGNEISGIIKCKRLSGNVSVSISKKGSPWEVSQLVTGPNIRTKK